MRLNTAALVLSMMLRAERSQKNCAMRLFVEAEGSTEIDKVKEVLGDGSGLDFNGR
jgi:hypothetical protein